MKEMQIDGYRPGAIGRIAELHAVYYSRNWDFGLFFERKVATELSEFLGRFNPDHDGFWIALSEDRIVGSIAIDGSDRERDGAHLRWFIVEPDFHGYGIGGQLIRSAISFCDAAGFGKIYLWTFAGLDAARKLYERHGFSMVYEEMADQWGITVKEQKFERVLSA